MLSSRSRALLFAALALGVFFRLYHADWKIYREDEVVTSVRVSGTSGAESDAFIADGKLHAMRELERFLWPQPGKTPRDVVESLAIEDPQHPPLFYLLNFGVARLGLPDTIVVRRSVAIAFGILCLPAAWFLGIELFRNTRDAALFCALVALSPFQVEFAQFAREYGMWVFVTMLSSALLLRTVRTHGRASSLAYALSAATGLWVYTFFAFVLAAHALFVLFETGVPRRTRLWCLFSAAAGACGFLPWALNLAQNMSLANRSTGWMETPLSPELYAGKFLFNAGATFFDLDFLSLALFPVALVLLATSAGCAYLMIRRSVARTTRFIALLGGGPLVVFLANDFVRHQSVALGDRYLSPVWVALELATAAGLGCAFEAGKRWNAGARAATTAYVAAGLCSLAVASNARDWWIAPGQRSLPAIARVLATHRDATIVCCDGGFYLTLVPYVPGDLTFRYHRKLDDGVLREAAHAFAIALPSDIEPGTSFASLPLPTLFPPPYDPLMASLKRRSMRVRGLAPVPELELVTTRAEAERARQDARTGTAGRRRQEIAS